MLPRMGATEAPSYVAAGSPSLGTVVMQRWHEVAGPTEILGSR